MAGLTISFTIPDLKKQVFLFKRAPKVYAKNIMEALQAGVKQTHTGWRDVAAVETGHYRNTLKPEIKSIASAKTIQGAVRSFATSTAGFPYPRALEESVRYHYRSTRRRGQRTAGKVVKMFLRLKPTIQKGIKAAVDKTVKSMVVK